MMLASMARWSAIFGGGHRDDNNGGGMGAIGMIAMSIIAPMAAMIIQMAVSRSREYLADATGAGLIAARRAGAEIVDPRPFAEGEIAEAFQKYTHLTQVLPALGYGEKQVAELQATINRTDCDVVIIGTPIDLSRIVSIDKPHVRVTYSLEEITKPGLKEILADRIG